MKTIGAQTKKNSGGEKTAYAPPRNCIWLSISLFLISIKFKEAYP
jgi:hypothetical protein